MFSIINDTYFTTFTCNSWISVLDLAGCKEVTLNTFEYLHNNNIATIYAFVIMPNHVHVIWAVKEKEIKYLKAAFTSVTAHKMLQMIKQINPEFLNKITSTQTDRKYQFWERRSYWKSVPSENIFIQKLKYIHLNPVRKRWTLAPSPEEYEWSSAKSYYEGKSLFEFLTLFHFN